ncbi:cytochrome P450 3A8 [Rhipicephalus sanguineus]|uniref:cytochrome P450 3A8 n=1 Tax=Rhipicephalus sanguineus TaxID=34632 RepID=UPI0020C336F9|nr:cytochrome P450 3A8 [Rhipicephalus sanguineus]
MELIGLPDWLLLAATAVVLLYMYATRYRNYWKKQNIPQEDFSLIFCPALRIFYEPFYVVDDERYQKLGRVFGIYEGGKPTLLVGEPELVKQVLVKDFPLLGNRRTVRNFEPLMDNMMLVAPVEKWRKIRASASPAFSAGRLRRMYELVQACTEITSDHLENAARQNKEVDLKQLYGKFALDVVARCAFGTTLDSHTDSGKKVATEARKALSSGVTLSLLMHFLFPGLTNVLRLKALDSESFHYLENVCVTIIQKRKEKRCRQEDFLQLMMDAQERALDESAESTPGKESSEIFNHKFDIRNDVSFSTKLLSEDEALAQCVLFFLAGYDTTASVIACAGYSLALNPEVQAKLRKEVDECIATHGKEPSLDTVSKLPYLHCVVSETMRMYPISALLERTTSEDYVLGDTGIRVPKGCVIGIPVYSMHRDPEFFPNPEKFDPDRFSEKNVASIRPYSYLPFGAGPRNCIGMRFAWQVVKLSLLHSVHRVQFVRTEKTEVPLDFVTSTNLHFPKSVTVGIRERPEL